MPKTIFKNNVRPEFKGDAICVPQGNALHIGQLDQRLTPREWMYLYFYEARNLPAGFLEKMIGSRTTIFRVRKSLKAKGFL